MRYIIFIMANHYFYVLLCADKTLYGGYTTDLQKRLETHNAGKGAKYTQPRRPVQLILDAFLGGKAESYYALVLMDGDKLGAWLAGDEGRQKMERRFHVNTVAALKREG